MTSNPAPANRHPVGRFRFYDKARSLSRHAWATAASTVYGNRRSLNLNAPARVQRKLWERYNVSGRYEHIYDYQERRKLVLNTIDRGHFGWWVVFVAGIGFFTDAYDIFAINMVLPMIGEVYYNGAIPSSYSTAMKSATLVGAMFGMVGIGILADRYGRRKMYGLELIIMIFGTIGVAMCSEGVNNMSLLGWMVFWRVLMGIGIGADYPLSAVITAEFAPTRHRGRMLCVLFLMQAFGQLVGTLATLAATRSFRNHISTGLTAATCGTDLECRSAIDSLWRLVVGIGAIPAFIALFFRLTIPESPRYTLDVNKDFAQAGDDVVDYFGADYADLEQSLGFVSGGENDAVLAELEGGESRIDSWRRNAYEVAMDREQIQQQHTGRGEVDAANTKARNIALTALALADPSRSSMAGVTRETGDSIRSLEQTLPSSPVPSIAMSKTQNEVISQNVRAHETSDYLEVGGYGSEGHSPHRWPRSPSRVHPIREAETGDQTQTGFVGLPKGLPPSKLPTNNNENALRNSLAISENTLTATTGANTYPYVATWADAKRYFLALGKWRHLAGTSLSWFVLDFAFFGLGMNSPAIIAKIWDTGKQQQDPIYETFFNTSTRSLVVVSIGAVIGGTIMVKAIDHWGTKKTQFWGFITLGALFIVAGTVYRPLIATQFHGVIVTLYVVCQIFFNLGPNTTTFIVPAEIFATRYRCTSHGIAAAAGKLGSVIAQVFLAQTEFGGKGIEDEGATWLGYVLLVLAGFMFAGAGLTMLWVPETRDLRIPVVVGSRGEVKKTSKGKERSYKWRLMTLEELSGEREYLPDYPHGTAGIMTATPRPDPVIGLHRRSTTRAGWATSPQAGGAAQGGMHVQGRQGSGVSIPSLSENQSVESV